MPVLISSFAFSQRMWNMRNVRFACDLNGKQINHIRANLFPEITIPAQREIFIPKKPTQEGLNRLMDMAQERLARNMGDGHRVIHSVAGSGKTLILVFRAKYLVKTLKKPVLVINFTRALAQKLKNLLQKEDDSIDQNIEIVHFHAWCKNQCQNVRILPPYDKNVPIPRWKILENVTIAGVRRGIIPKEQYGTVLIDEGHDFEADWLRLPVQMVDESTQFLLFIYDRAQSIYGRRRDPLKIPTLASAGMQARGRTTALKKTTAISVKLLISPTD